MKIPTRLVKIKFQFDLGQGWLSIVNFAFLVITASDKLAMLMNVSIKTMLLILIPLVFTSVWFFGWLVDTSGFHNKYTSEQNRTNDLLTELSKRNKL